MQKDLFGHNFRTKALKMTNLASRYVLEVKKSDDAICFDRMTLTCQGHDLCKIAFWAISQLLKGKMGPNLKQASLGRVLLINKKYLEWFERVTYKNALCWPPLYKKNIFNLNFRHLG